MTKNNNDKNNDNNKENGDDKDKRHLTLNQVVCLLYNNDKFIR